MSNPRPPLMSFEDALKRLLEVGVDLGGQRTTEDINLQNAHGRVLARVVISTINVPPMDNSSMDGYAIRMADAHLVLPVSQRIPAGSAAMPLLAKTAARIFTGAPIPSGADTVVLQELVTTADLADDVAIQINAQVHQGDWIRRAGEDITVGSEVVAAGTLIDPIVCGLIASVGQAIVTVYTRLRVACFFTGDELTMPGQPLRAGAIYNSNRFVLTAALRDCGCEVLDLGIVPDTLAATRSALVEAAHQCDLIITSGGVSVGDEDHIKPAVLAEGSIDMWQISMKPGKPLAWGQVHKANKGNHPAVGVDAKPGSNAMAQFLGLPGNPVSSYATFTLLAKPFIRALQGAIYRAPTQYNLQADFDWPRPDKRREFLRALVLPNGSLQLYPTQSSGALTSLARADGLIDNPGGNPIARGDWVRFIPFANSAL